MVGSLYGETATCLQPRYLKEYDFFKSSMGNTHVHLVPSLSVRLRMEHSSDRPAFLGRGCSFYASIMSSISILFILLWLLVFLSHPFQPHHFFCFDEGGDPDTTLTYDIVSTLFRIRESLKGLALSPFIKASTNSSSLG